MKTLDWRIKVVIIMIILCFIMIASQILVNRQYKGLLTESTSELNSYLCNYIDTQIDSANNLVSEFELLQDFDLSRKEKAETYINTWVDNTKGVLALYYYDVYGNEYTYDLYESNSYKKKVREISQTEIISNDIEMMFDADLKLIYIYKDLYNESKYQGKIICVYDYSYFAYDIDMSGLYSNNINVRIYDLYNNVIYQNDPIIDNTTDVKENERYVGGLGNDVEINVVKRTFDYLKYYFTRTFTETDSDLIESEIESKYGLYRIKIFCNANDASYFFQTRLSIYIIVMCLNVFILSIIIIFVKKEIDKTKIYSTVVLLVSILCIIYFSIEIVVLDKVSEKMASMNSFFIGKTIEGEMEAIKSSGDTIFDALKNISKYDSTQNESIKSYYRKLFYRIKKYNKEILNITLFLNGNEYLSYPNDDTEVESNFANFINEGRDAYYNGDETILYYSVNDNFKLAYKYKSPSYVSNSNESIRIKDYEYQTTNDKNDKTALFERISKNRNVIEVTNKIKFFRVYSKNEIDCYIFVFNSNLEVTHIYVIAETNRFNNVFVLFIGTLLLIIGIVIIVQIINKKLTNNQKKLSNRTDDDIVVLDRLLKKINDDVSAINKSYDDMADQVDLNDINDIDDI